MNKKKNISISILITNYNKYKYLNKSLSYATSQNYNNYEVILFDDYSTDQSIDLIKKYKKIKLIKNKKEKIPSAPLLNQNNAIVEAFKASRGDLICLMDADDVFFKKKLYYINNFFLKNKNKNFVVNEPESKNIKFKYEIKNKSKHKWSYVFPTSCVSFRRNFFKKFLKYSRFKEFKNLGIDARLIMFAKYYCNDFNIIKKKLNTYTFDKKGNYSNYTHLGINWWISRNEAFEYLKYILNVRRIKFKKNIDYYLTKLIYYFLKDKITS